MNLEEAFQLSSPQVQAYSDGKRQVIRLIEIKDPLTLPKMIQIDLCLVSQEPFFRMRHKTEFLNQSFKGMGTVL